MIKLITRQEYRFGQKQIVPFLNEVVVSESGILEVESEDIAKSLVELNIGFEFEEASVEQDNVIEPSKPKAFNPDEVLDWTETELSSIKALSIEQKADELRKACEIFEKSEWGHLTSKEKLAKFLVYKLRSAEIPTK